MRIAMWSGPRNLSTAMMYAFAARNDCAIWDEPYYAAYLNATGLDHPMGDEILAAGLQDPAQVARRVLGDIPGGKPNYYQKHMTHHMLTGFDQSWFGQCHHVFLIRHPARVVASYGVKRQDLTLDDIGFRQQAEIFDRICQITGRAPPVIDSFDIRQDPTAKLSALCAAIDLPFQTSMLHWPIGGHAEDGIWGAHWYGAVRRSTGFAGAEAALPEVDAPKRPIVTAALPYYNRLAQYRL